MKEPAEAPSEEKLRSVISAADTVFSECRDSLEDGLGDKEQIVAFQPKLARAIYGLEVWLLRLKRAERALVKAKGDYAPAEIAPRFRIIHRQVSALERAIDVGLLLGDAFAWMFYRRTPQLLRNHYTHERVRHLPVGTGGLGEIAFIENNPVVGHHLVLYHGITTFLRIGDISLLNLGTGKIDGLAELKTRQVGDDRVEIAVNYSGFKLKAPTSFTVTPQPQMPTRHPKFAAILERQMKTIRRAIEPASKPQIGGGTTLRFAPECLADLYDRATEEKPASMQVSAGLVVAGFKMGGSTLAERMFDSKRPDSAMMDSALKEVRKLVVPGAKDNSVEIGTLIFLGGDRYHLTYGMKPLRWWPLRRDVRHAIADGRFLVITFFNPASLLARFRARGHTVVSARKGRGFMLHVADPEKPLTFGPLDHFFDLISQRMMKEDSVFDSICRVIERVQSKYPGENAKIGLELFFESLEPGEPDPEPSE